ncbi:MAG: hypothetical protein ACLQCU_08395 [Acidimicrobiales bacterium]
MVVPATAVGGFLVLVAIFYVSARHAFAGDSDGATVVLQGQAMGTGNLTLHGWALSLDSFWTVDAVVYTLVELVTGVRGMLLFLVPSMIAACVVVLGALLAREGRRGIAGVAAAATVVVVLGLPSHALANVFLRGPLHVGTALLCLCAFAGLRSGRFGWAWVAAVLCLAAGVLGDFQTAALGIGSVCAAGVVAMLRTRDWRSGVPEVGAAVAGLILAAVVRSASDVVGTFSVNTGHPRASGSQMITNLHYLPSWGANMLGVGGGQLGNGGVPVALEAVHLIGLLVVTGGIIAGTVAMVGGAIRGRASPVPSSADWRLEDLLVLAVFADLIVFIVLTTSDDPGFLRYLTAAVIFGAVLAGRWVGRLAASIPSAPLLRKSAAVVCLAVVAALAAAFGFTLAGPMPKQSFAQLDKFLEARELDVGIGDYWSASLTTVATGGVVTVRPVISTPGGSVVRYQRQSAATWYTNQPFEFLVYDTARPWGGIDATTASSTFGPVARTYVVGPYRVLVWRHPLFVPGTRLSPVRVYSTNPSRATEYLRWDARTGGADDPG